jgi:hypothetical protein
MAIPQHLVNRSHGAAINALLAFLSRYLLPREKGELKFDAVFGNTGTMLLMRFQKHHSHALRVTGDLDAGTRAQMKSYYDFDFDEAARSTGGTTVFVQSDGSQISWSLKLERAEKDDLKDPNYDPGKLPYCL